MLYALCGVFRCRKNFQHKLCVLVGAFCVSCRLFVEYDAFLFLCFRYIFFATLLSIPESSFSVAFRMFDVNNNGCVYWKLG